MPFLDFSLESDLSEKLLYAYDYDTTEYFGHMVSSLESLMTEMDAMTSDTIESINTASQRLEYLSHMAQIQPDSATCSHMLINMFFMMVLFTLCFRPMFLNVRDSSESTKQLSTVYAEPIKVEKVRV